MKTKFHQFLLFALLAPTIHIAQPDTIVHTFNSNEVGFRNVEGLSSGVLTTAIQPDGIILNTEVFTSYSGTTINFIARLNTDGLMDASFNIPLLN